MLCHLRADRFGPACGSCDFVTVIRAKPAGRLVRRRHRRRQRHPDRTGSGNGAQQFGQRPQRFWQCGQNAAASAAGNGPAGPFEARVTNSGGSARSPVMSRISPRELAELRGPRAKAVARERQRLLDKNLTSICRGC